jgi:hypothetical protein
MQRNPGETPIGERLEANGRVSVLGFLTAMRTELAKPLPDKERPVLKILIDHLEEAVNPSVALSETQANHFKYQIYAACQITAFDDPDAHVSIVNANNSQAVYKATMLELGLVAAINSCRE